MRNRKRSDNWIQILENKSKVFKEYNNMNQTSRPFNPEIFEPRVYAAFYVFPAVIFTG